MKPPWRRKIIIEESVTKGNEFRNFNENKGRFLLEALN
jgi:hypothetical protein